MQKKLKTQSIPFTLSGVEGHPERSRMARLRLAAIHLRCAIGGNDSNKRSYLSEVVLLDLGRRAGY